MHYFVLFSFLLFFSIPAYPSISAGDISHHLHFLQARKNKWIVYDQAGVLLLKVIQCLVREHAVLERVDADGKIEHNKWN